MNKFYQVAGHCFALDMPEDVCLRPLLFNYMPFEVASAGEIVFGMTVSMEGADFAGALNNSLPREYPGTSIQVSEDGDFEIAIFPGNWANATAMLSLSHDFSEGYLALLNRDDAFVRFSIDTALMLQYAFATADRSTLLLHASVVVKDGMAYAFAGKSGTGKSTHSMLWMKHIPDTYLLNDDNPVLRINEEGRVLMAGSPWSGKTPCYKQETVPLAGIARLFQYNRNAIERLPLLEAYLALGSSTSAFHVETVARACMERVTDGIHRSIQDVIRAVPIYSLSCLPDADAARLCFETMGARDKYVKISLF